MHAVQAVPQRAALCLKDRGKDAVAQQPMCSMQGWSGWSHQRLSRAGIVVLLACVRAADPLEGEGVALLPCLVPGQAGC